MRKLRPFVVLAALLLFWAAEAPASAAEPKLSLPEVSVEENRARLTFRLEGPLGRKFFDRIDSGLPTAVLYQVELQEVRQGWYDKTLDKTELEVLVTYDALEREYLVHYRLGGDLIESRMARTRPELFRAMTRFRDLPVFPLVEVSRKARLRVRMRAHLGSRTLFAMIPSDITTEWVESRKFRP